jgi:hypothetical protein
LVSGTDESFRKRDDATIFVHKYNHDASETQLGATWRQLYDAINRANLLLANIDKPSLDAAKNRCPRGYKPDHTWGGSITSDKWITL